MRILESKESIFWMYPNFLDVSQFAHLTSVLRILAILYNISHFSSLTLQRGCVRKGGLNKCTLASLKEGDAKFCPLYN